MVTHANQRMLGANRVTNRRLVSGVKTYPNATHPKIFGTAKATNPGQPHHRSRRMGKNMPMHHVQLLAKYKPQPTISTDRRIHAS